jgi:hypothetical protein
MAVDQRDAWVRAYLEEVFNGHDLRSLDKYMSENLVSPGWVTGACAGGKPGERRWPTSSTLFPTPRTP